MRISFENLVKESSRGPPLQSADTVYHHEWLTTITFTIIDFLFFFQHKMNAIAAFKPFKQKATLLSLQIPDQPPVRGYFK